MKKIFSAILAAIGISSTLHADPTVKMVDPKTIRFTVPTVAADTIQFVMPSKESFKEAPQFHEDEWGQIEFFPKARLTEIQNMLKEFKSFEIKNRTRYGWNDIFARKISRSPILPPGVSTTDLSSLVSGQLKPAPILGTASRPLGQIKDGFSIKLGTNAHLYGILNSTGITVLGAHLAGADDMLLTKAFKQLSEHYGLILVDWRQQLILVSMAPNGKLDAWKP